MKCTLNENELFELTPVQLNLLRHVIPAHQVEDHIKGLIHYILGQKLRDCAVKLFEEWKPKLFQEGVKEVPLADLELAEMIFNRADYVSRAQDNGNADEPAADTLPQN